MTNLRTPRTLLALGGAAALTGCLSFGPKPPPSLIRLQPAAAAPADAGQPLSGDRSLTVMVPHGPNALGVNRVAVRSGNAQLAYLKDAQFADSPYRLLRDLWGEVIQARTGRPVLDGRDYHLAPGARLVTNVDEFSVDADRRQVDLVVDAILQQPAPTPAPRPGARPAPAAPPAPGAVLTRRFEAHAPVSAITPAAVGPALGQAANDVGVQMADWIGR